MDRLTAAVAAALDEAPCTLNALARAAGVPAPHLSNIRHGKRKASAALAARVADALEAWGTDCTAAARRIHQAQRRRKR